MADDRQGVLIRQLQGRVPKASGAGTVTWPGGSAVSNLLTVNHGLQSTPQAQAQAQAQAGIGQHSTYIEFVSATQIGIRVVTVGGFAPANTTTTPVAWWAY